MYKIISLVLLLVLVAAAMACGDAPDSNTVAADEFRPGGGPSPTEAYKNLFEAVKAKNTEAIRSHMTKDTLAFAEMASKQNNKPVEEVLANGFTATTFSEVLPQIRDERIDGNMGAVEVWNAKDNKWEDLGFVNEGGGWRLAVGEKFGGRYSSPGKGRDQLEREAANLTSNNMIEIKPASNANVDPKIIVPKHVPATPAPQNK